MASYLDLKRARLEKDISELATELNELEASGESNKAVIKSTAYAEKLASLKEKLLDLDKYLIENPILYKLTLKWFNRYWIKKKIDWINKKLNKELTRSERDFSKIIYKYFSGGTTANKLYLFSMMNFGKDNKDRSGIPGWAKSIDSQCYWSKKGTLMRSNNTELRDRNGNLVKKDGHNKGGNENKGKDKKDHVNDWEAISKVEVLGRATTFNRILSELVDIDEPSEYIEGEVARALFEICYNYEIPGFIVKDAYDKKKISVVPFSLKKAFEFLQSDLAREVLGESLFRKVSSLKSRYKDNYNSLLKEICDTFTNRINSLSVLRKNHYGMDGKKANFLTFNPVITKASTENRSKYHYLDDYLGNRSSKETFKGPEKGNTKSQYRDATESRDENKRKNKNDEDFPEESFNPDENTDTGSSKPNKSTSDIPQSKMKQKLNKKIKSMEDKLRSRDVDQITELLNGLDANNFYDKYVKDCSDTYLVDKYNKLHEKLSNIVSSKNFSSHVIRSFSKISKL